MPSDHDPWNTGRPPEGPPRGPRLVDPGPSWGGGGPGGPIPPNFDHMAAQFTGWLRSLFKGGLRGLGLLGLALAAIWLSTGFYRVEPDELGLVLRFGAYTRSTPPGLNYHAPWPIESVILLPVTRINRVEIGFRSEETEEATAANPERDLREESLMLTGDENIVDINASVFWRISNAPDYAFKTRNQPYTVKSVAESVLRQVVGHTKIQSALTEGRAAIEQAVTIGAQKILDEYGTGVEITQVQLQKVDPPPEVIESFRDVQRANTDADRARNEAQSYANDIVPRARGDAAAIEFAAQGDKQAAIASANGQSQRFLSVYAAYAVAKDVTLKRLYIETMQDMLSHAETTVVDDKLRNMLPLLNLNRAPSQEAPEMNRFLTGLLLVAVFALLAVNLTFFEVDQTQTVLITQLGEPVRVITTPGLATKLPLIQTAIAFDNRLLDYESPPEEVILGDQRRLIVDSFTRYRITNPLDYYKAVGPTEDGIRARLNSVVTSSLRRVLGNESLLDVLSAQRERIMASIRQQVNGEMSGFGVKIVDVRIRRADLPQENTDAILQRMKSERDRVAAQARAEGAEAAAKIRADADRQRTVILADARANADRLRGEGEAQTIAIYANAFQRDPGFFTTWRTLQAYKEAFANGHTKLVLTPDNDFLRLMQGTGSVGK